MTADPTHELMKMVERIGAERDRLRIENAHLRGIVKAMIENEPNDMAADGVTCLQVWRTEGAAILS